MCRLVSVIVAASLGSHAAFATTPAWNDYAAISMESGTGESSGGYILPVRTPNPGPPAVTLPAPTTTVSSGLQGLIDDYAAGTIPDQTVEVLGFVWDETIATSAPYAVLEKEIIEGTAVTSADKATVLAAAVADHKDDVTSLVNATLASIAPGTISVTERMDHVPFVRFNVALSDLSALVSANHFQTLEDIVVDNDVDLTGTQLEFTLDSQQFYDFNDDGVFRSTGDFDGSSILAGQMEQVMVDPSAPGFDDGTGASRVLAGRDCTISGCPTATGPLGGHATAVASAYMGDITLGQDSSITGASARLDRSNVARSSTLQPFVAPHGAAYGRVLNHHVAAIGSPDDSTSCSTLRECPGQDIRATTRTLAR